MDTIDKETISAIRNKLQAPKTALEKIIRDEMIPKSFKLEALDELNQVVGILKDLIQE